MIPFDWLFGDVSEERGYVDYILPAPVVCPRCSAVIHEKTLVELVRGL
jgi:hypothetical protein